MSDLSISDDELAILLAMNGEMGDELNQPAPSAAAPAAHESPPAEAPAERILSQAEIDALLASMGG